jgi:hypothetical protein
MKEKRLPAICPTAFIMSFPIMVMDVVPMYGMAAWKKPSFNSSGGVLLAASIPVVPITINGPPGSPGVILLPGIKKKYQKKSAQSLQIPGKQKSNTRFFTFFRKKNATFS